MKLNFVQAIIALAISTLVSYGFYIFNESENNIIFSLGSFVIFSTSLIFSLGTDFELPRTTTNVRVVSVIYFMIAMISMIVFTIINPTVPSFIIVNAIMLLLYVLIIYSIFKAKQ